jgi:predicted kinase
LPETRPDADLYTSASNQRAYAAVNKATAGMLAAGQSVVIDAVFARGPERAASAQTATSGGSLFKGLWLAASDTVRCSRVSGRTFDASDADADVDLAEAKLTPGALGDRITLSADVPLNDAVTAAAAILRRDEVWDLQTCNCSSPDPSKDKGPEHML